MDPQTPAVIDLEASGLGRGSYPIEVGYVLADGTSFCSLVKPQDEWQHWDSSAQALHGIQRKHLFERGREVLDLAQSLNQALAGLTLYSDAWGQDNSWLMALYQAAGIWPNFKLQSIRYIISEQQLPFWHQAKDQVIAELQIGRHRASADALIIQQTYLLSRQMMLQGENRPLAK